MHTFRTISLIDGILCFSTGVCLSAEDDLTALSCVTGDADSELIITVPAGYTTSVSSAEIG